MLAEENINITTATTMPTRKTALMVIVVIIAALVPPIIGAVYRLDSTDLYGYDGCVQQARQLAKNDDLTVAWDVANGGCLVIERER